MERIKTLDELLPYPRKSMNTGKITSGSRFKPLAKAQWFVLPLEYPEEWLIEGQYIEVLNKQGTPLITNAIREKWVPANEAQKF